MMRRAAPALVLVAGACAYYNGIYNSKTLAKTADKQTARGESYLAQQAYLQSAATAETVLARHPKTRWRSDAMFLSARGFALAGECGRGMRRLSEYLALPNQPSERREQALVARGACYVTLNQLLAADTVLAPLLNSQHQSVRAQAALWEGKALMSLGDAARAETLLARVPGTTAIWEFMTAAMKLGNYGRAESLLVNRASAGEYLSVVQSHVRTLWAERQRAAAVRVVDLYGISRAPTADRVALRFLLSDLAFVSGDTALARRQAAEAQRLGLSPAVDADARARLLALRIRELDALPDVEAAVARDSAKTRGSPIIKRINDNLTMARLLLGNRDTRGAAVFLAAEILRDSLRANRVAHTMFRSIERDYDNSELAARALLAARAMFPESTAVYEARILQKWDSSSAAFALKGLDPTYSTKRGEDGALKNAWTFLMKQWDDTLKARRAADSINALGVKRQ